MLPRMRPKGFVISKLERASYSSATLSQRTRELPVLSRVVAPEAWSNQRGRHELRRHGVLRTALEDRADVSLAL